MGWVQSAPVINVAGTSATQTAVFNQSGTGANPVIGNTIIVAVGDRRSNSSGPETVTDNYGNSYAPVAGASAHIVDPADGTHYIWAILYSATVTTTGAALTVSLAPAGGAGGTLAAVMEYALLPSPLDQASGNSATSSTANCTPGSITPGVVPTIAILVATSQGGSDVFVTPTGFTARALNNAGPADLGVVCDQVLTSTSSINPSVARGGGSATWACCIATFKMAAQPPTAPAITITTSGVGGTDTISVTAAPPVGTFPLATSNTYQLFAGVTAGSEVATGVYATPGGYPLAFATQTAAAAGATKYYYVKAYDNQGTPNASVPSVEVSSRFTGIVNTGVTYKRRFTAPYGSAGAGLTNIGYTIFSADVGAILQAHTSANVYELPDYATMQSGVTGQYIVWASPDIAWDGTVVWDAPAGASPFTESFGPPAELANMALFWKAQLKPTVQASPAPTTTTFAGPSSLSSSDNFAGYLKAFILFVTGQNAGVAKECTAYTGGTRLFTTAAFPFAPAAGDQFIPIGQGA